MSAPTVTVIVPSYNYAHYLPDVLHSALAQSFANFELLLVEDGSTDQSLAVAQTVAARDKRVRILTHADRKNHGLPASLALALDHAQGECVAFLEADDLWHPDSLRLRLQARAETGAGVVFSDIEPLLMPGVSRAWFDSYVSRVMREHAQRAGVHPARGTQTRPFTLHTEFLAENKIPTFSCALVDKALLRSCSLASPVARWFDWWLWTQLAQKTSFAFVPEKLTQWRLHTSSLHHRIMLLSYLNDYNAMWQGFRHELTAKSLPNSPQNHILRMPAWTRLAARFCRMAQGCGARRTMSSVFSRLL